MTERLYDTIEALAEAHKNAVHMIDVTDKTGPEKPRELYLLLVRKGWLS